MKNTIIYYYDIKVEDYRKSEKKFIFFDSDQNMEYEFVEYFGNIKEMIDIYMLLRYNNQMNYEIILNKNNEVITFFDNKPYILLKNKNQKIKKEIELNDLLNKESVINSKAKINWKKLWGDKNDYYENYLDNVKMKYPIIKSSLSYYIGMSELAINLLSYVNYNDIDYVISHKRINKISDLYNPTNLLIDSRTRDIAEFIKLKYINDELNQEKIFDFIKFNYFSKDECILLLARLIYPTYYFDLCEKVCFYNEKEDKLNKIIKKNVHYESFLKVIYNILKNKQNIMVIDFLEN